ncbi:pectin lyase fold/virulence factor [Podospora fimiseda]|uniref:Pectin lyase fold/virulence factor n=1 Tax=Podospora fimiseda TaxID=252190 RepID=A0AAN7BL88_9PEZI|nr:pectin lyase fold/virulence factor [Podospora fimiseda]
MKVLSLTLLLGMVTAVPTTTLQPGLKKANISDVATIGYATLNGGTTGGAGGEVVIVSTVADFVAAVAEKKTAPAIVLINGTLVGDQKIRIASHKTIIGLPGSSLRGIGLHFRRQRNLIIRNLKSSFVVASNEDALKIEESTNVWVDHCEFHSTMASDKDYYDGLIDASHASDFITISNTYFHDHWKASLVGHSDSNAAQDKGKLRITYAHNYWKNIGSRTPLVRFGTAHIFNSVYQSVDSGINTRMGAQVLVQNNVFKDVKTAVTSKDSKEVGFAVVQDNDLGRGRSEAPSGTLQTRNIPYNFTLLKTSIVGSLVPSEAGTILTFEIPTKPVTTTTTTSVHTSTKTSTASTTTLTKSTISTTITTTSLHTSTKTSSSTGTTSTKSTISTILTTTPTSTAKTSTKSRISTTLTTTTTVTASTTPSSTSPTSVTSSTTSTSSPTPTSESVTSVTTQSMTSTPEISTSSTPPPTTSELATSGSSTSDFDTESLTTTTPSMTSTPETPTNSTPPSSTSELTTSSSPTPHPTSEPFTTTPQPPTITPSVTGTFPSTASTTTTTEAEGCEAQPSESAYV